MAENWYVAGHDFPAELIEAELIEAELIEAELIEAELIEEVKPNVVVYELVERRLMDLQPNNPEQME